MFKGVFPSGSQPTYAGRRWLSHCPCARLNSSARQVYGMWVQLAL